MFERFTVKARAVIERAQVPALQRGDGYIGTEHLLLALVQPNTGIASTVLAAVDVTADRVTEALDNATQRPGIVSEEDVAVLIELGIDAESILEQARMIPGDAQRAPVADGGHRPYTKKAKKALENSLREAIQLKDNYIGTEHLLLGLLRTDGLALEVLRDLGVDLADVRQRAIDARSSAA